VKCSPNIKVPPETSVKLQARRQPDHFLHATSPLDSPRDVECATLSYGLRSDPLVSNINMETVRTTWQIFILTHFYFFHFSVVLSCIHFHCLRVDSSALRGSKNFSSPSSVASFVRFSLRPLNTSSSELKYNTDCQDGATSKRPA
jgi:hypothetical protein